MDYIRGTSGFMGVRICQRLRYWRIHSPAIGNRRSGVVDSVDSRAQLNLRRSPDVAVTIWIRTLRLRFNYLDFVRAGIYPVGGVALTLQA